MSTYPEDTLVNLFRSVVPILSKNKYKGQDGRIGIFGGSVEYSGAPYFAGLTALRSGADLVHIFCTKDASTPIKTFSPELIVHPFLDRDDAMGQIEPWLDILHVVVIGPGLGRDQKIFNNVAQIIATCRRLSKPIVIDADGLFLVCQRPEIVRDYSQLVLTPNAVEFTRLFKAYLNESIEPVSVPNEDQVKKLACTVGQNVVILHKGNVDLIASGQKGGQAISCSTAGSGRRCGGQGDLLSGSLAVFWWWANKANFNEKSLSPGMIAAYGACRLVRECNASAFVVKKRGMLASDMVEQVPNVFERIFEVSKK